MEKFLKRKKTNERKEINWKELVDVERKGESTGKLKYREKAKKVIKVKLRY